MSTSKVLVSPLMGIDGGCSGLESTRASSAEIEACVVDEGECGLEAEPPGLPGTEELEPKVEIKGDTGECDDADADDADECAALLSEILNPFTTNSCTLLRNARPIVSSTNMYLFSDLSILSSLVTVSPFRRGCDRSTRCSYVR